MFGKKSRKIKELRSALNKAYDNVLSVSAGNLNLEKQVEVLKAICVDAMVHWTECEYNYTNACQVILELIRGKECGCKSKCTKSKVKTKTKRK